MNFIIEIATTDFETTKAAVKGGADRIELCASLVEGGTTPSAGMMKICRENFSVPLFPIIRPRGGDFLYSDEEFDIMLADILLAKELGCDGVVTGILKKDGRVDKKRTSQLVQAAYPMEVTFHRAFDRALDPFASLEDVIETGCTRLLTSGQQPGAPAGAGLIAKLVKKADSRIIIMPGSGVRKENIKQLAETTGAIEFHSSLRSRADSKMEFIHPAFADSEESYSNHSIDPKEVIALREALQA
jgi:copper homeostasis protein